MSPTPLIYHPLPALQWGVVIGASLAAAAWDVRTRRIPNLLSGPVLLGGLAVGLLVAGWRGLGDAAAGCLLLGIPYVLLFIFAGGGAGDAKMMGALGAWLGFSNGVVALVAVTVSGALLGAAYALAKKKAVPVLKNLRQIAIGVLILVPGRVKLAYVQEALPAEQQMLAMPYGLAILVGMCAAVGGKLLWNL